MTAAAANAVWIDDDWRLNPATGRRVPIALATGESHFRDCYAARSFSKKRG